MSSCTGYRLNHGQYTMSSCTQESSTFFVILGFTMLVLLILLGLILIIACFRRQRQMSEAASGNGPSGAPGSQQDCAIQMDGAGQFTGKNFESVKCVIMAGEDQPTFLAHPVIPFHPKTHEDDDPVKGKEQQQEVVGETSKQQQQQEEPDMV